MSIHLFGIRHHGPGCARSLLAALEALTPDVLLIEGPPDGEEMLPLATSDDLVPPVALLIYPVDEPQRGVFYPFALFSPEWQAIRYGHKQGIPLRFMDLPLRHRLPLEKKLMGEMRQRLEQEAASNTTEPASDSTNDEQDVTHIPPDDTTATLDDDPLGMLAVAAGYRDHELWWEHQIEQRLDPTGLFDGIHEAMTTLRSSQESRDGYTPRPFEIEREASMRQIIRQAERDGFERIAVVCGAWHVPALSTLDDSKADADLLKNLPKEKVAATWTPWTYSRLSYRSGYGAGVRSPGWYEHLWKAPRSAPLRWVTAAARLLRDEDLDASSASVIEAVRLGEALAAMRELPLVGLAELNEAILATLCAGNPTPLNLVREKLEIGDRLGTVPADAPSVPLARDLESQQKSLRLKPSTEIKTLDLDLRSDIDRERSRLIHRLRVLGIPWGEPQEVRGKAGTFHELWRLQWQVEYVVRVIEMSVWGTTIERAAGGFARDQAQKATVLPALTTLLEQVLLADLHDAVDEVIARLQHVAAVSADVRHLADALPPLARVARYSDVRKTEAEHLLPVVAGFFERIVVGLPMACRAIDDDAAEQLAASLDNVQQSLELLNRDDLRTEWRPTLTRLVDDDAVHGLIRGLSCRQLLEASQLSDEELHRRARLELSPASKPAEATAWLHGVLRGSGLLLVHRDALWHALDRWMIELSEESFAEMLPLVRRAFSGFTPPERRTMGEKVKNLKALKDVLPPRSPPMAAEIDADRAARVLPVLARILGIDVT